MGVESRGPTATSADVGVLLADAVTDAVLNVEAVEPERADAILGHDPADFSGFYLRHRVSLERRAARFFGDGRDVDEVVQETFLKVFLALPELETELAAVRFAYRVMTNMCIDRYRSECRRPDLLDLESVAYNLAEDLPEDPLIRAEDAAIVREALSRLTPEHRAALIKREIEEKSLAVIADEIGIPEHQVKHLLFRARRALRRILVGSAVDPAVDLTPGEVIDLTGRRLVAAANSTAARGTAIAVVLLVAIGWVLGAGSAFPIGHGSRGAVVSGGPQFGLVPPSEGARGGATPSTSGGSAAQHHGTHHAATSNNRRTGSGTPNRHGHRAPTPITIRHPVSPTEPPVSPPPTSPPPTSPPVTPPATPKFAVSGLLNSQNGAMQDQTRTVQGTNRYRSSANFVAATPSGMFQMAQALDFATSGGTVTAVTATLNPVVPVGNLGAGYVTVGQPTVSIQPVGSGYDVNVSGTATSLSGVDPGGQLAVTLHATYDSTLTEVTAEQVTLTSAGSITSPLPTASPSPSPDGNDSVVSSGQIAALTRLEW